MAETIPKKGKYYTAFFTNLKEGITYYRNLAGIAADNYECFSQELYHAEEALDNLHAHYAIAGR